MATKNKEVDALVRDLRKQGFTVELVKNGHWQAVSPSGRKAQFAASPSDRRNLLNAITRLRKIGYVKS